MVSKKSTLGFIILLVLCTCLMGIFTPVSAETLNFKAYGYPITRQVLPDQRQLEFPSDDN